MWVAIQFSKVAEEIEAHFQELVNFGVVMRLQKRVRRTLTARKLWLEDRAFSLQCSAAMKENQSWESMLDERFSSRVDQDIEATKEGVSVRALGVGNPDRTNTENLHTTSSFSVALVKGISAHNFFF